MIILVIVVYLYLFVYVYVFMEPLGVDFYYIFSILYGDSLSSKIERRGEGAHFSFSYVASCCRELIGFHRRNASENVFQVGEKKKEVGRVRFMSSLHLLHELSKRASLKGTRGPGTLKQKRWNSRAPKIFFSSGFAGILRKCRASLFTQESKGSVVRMRNQWVSRAPKIFFSSGPAEIHQMSLHPSLTQPKLLKPPATINVYCVRVKNVPRWSDNSRAPKTPFQLGLSIHQVQFLLTLFKTERIKMEALQEDVQSGSIREVGKKCEGE